MLPSGENIVYFITVENTGPSDISGALLSAITSSELNLVSWACSGTGFCSNATGNMPIDNESIDLAFGTALVFEVLVDVAASNEIIVDYTATLQTPTDTLELSPANNSAVDSDLIGLFADSFE